MSENYGSVTKETEVKHRVNTTIEADGEFFYSQAEMNGDQCVKYGSQALLIDRQFGIYATKSFAETYHPVDSQSVPVCYDELVRMCHVTGRCLPQPMIPILFYGYVQTANSPDDFYILPEGLEPAFNELFDKLQQFYSTKDQPMEQSDLSVDMPCVVKYNGDWTRAKIREMSSVSNDGRVTVYFVDWGNSSKVPAHDILPLAEEFAVFPPMALHCREENILCKEYKCEAVNNWLSVLKEIDFRVKVEMFTVKEPPYTVMLNIHPCARSPLTGLNVPVLGVKPSNPEEINEANIELAFKRVQLFIEYHEKQRKENFEFENKVDPDDSFELFCGLPPMTDEEFYTQKKLEFEEQEHQRKQNRRRQRTGPSVKVEKANMHIAQLRAQGKGPAEFIKWDEMPINAECEIYFERERPQYQSKLYSLKTKPTARQLREFFVSHVVNAREFYLHDVYKLLTIKHMTEWMDDEYCDAKYSTPEYTVEDDYITVGFICAIKDENTGHFVRGLVTEVETGKHILIQAVDFGWMFPCIPWENRAKLKALRAAGQLQAKPCVYRCKLRLVCQLPRTNIYARNLMRRLLPCGTVWHVFFEDRNVGPPFRVDMQEAYGSKAGCDLKDTFAEIYQLELGSQPKWTLRTTPYLPVGSKERKQATKNKQREERKRELETVDEAEEKVEEYSIQKGYYDVVVTQIDDIQHFYIQSYTDQKEIINFDNELNSFYSQGIKLSKKISPISPSKIFVGREVIAEGMGGKYYRSTVVDAEPEYNAQLREAVQVYRVRSMDYGYISSYTLVEKPLYPLTKIHSMKPMSALCCCLKGFQPNNIQLSKKERIHYSRCISYLFAENKLYHAYIEPTEDIVHNRRLNLVTLRDADGRSINEEIEVQLGMKISKMEKD